MSMSDNAATDVVFQRVGASAIDQVVDDLGLTSTKMIANMDTLHREVVSALGLHDANDLDAQVQAAGEKARQLAWLDPSRTNRSTPREVGSLLEAIWQDRAGRPKLAR